MKHAIDLLERCFNEALDKTTICTEQGDDRSAAEASASADDYYKALAILKEAQRQQLVVPRLSVTN